MQFNVVIIASTVLLTELESIANVVYTVSDTAIPVSFKGFNAHADYFDFYDVQVDIIGTGTDPWTYLVTDASNNPLPAGIVAMYGAATSQDADPVTISPPSVIDFSFFTTDAGLVGTYDIKITATYDDQTNVFTASQ